MNRPIVQSCCGITLVGGGPVPGRDLALALRRAPLLVAADGGADRVLAHGQVPQAVIGDMDSISAAAQAALAPERLYRLDEQETTDFDKALRSVSAPFVLGLGAAGGRLDHGLAVLNALVRHVGRACLVIGPQDVVFAAPPELRLRLTVGCRVSLFPMAAVTGESQGLEWPLQGLDFAPDALTGTSNRATARDVRLRFDAPGMLVILPRQWLDAAITGLTGIRPPWPPAPQAARGK